MPRPLWFIGLLFSLLCTVALSQTPGTIPSVKLPPSVPVAPIPGAAGVLAARQPFIARYAFCNSMQLYESRRAIWEPIYLDAGATAEQIENYRRDLVLFFKEFCSARPETSWRGVLNRLEGFDAKVDERNARVMGIAVADATKLRLGRMAAALDDFRRRCLVESSKDTALAGAQDLKTIYGSILPASNAPPGLSLDRQSTGKTLGRCSSTGAGASGPSLKIDDRSLSACIKNALSQASTCDSPVSEGPRGEIVARTRLPGSYYDSGGVFIRTTEEVDTYANGAREVVRQTTISWPDSRGNGRSVDIRERTVVGTAGEVYQDRTVKVDDEQVEFSSTGNMDPAEIPDRPSVHHDGDPRLARDSSTYRYHEVHVISGDLIAGYTTATPRGAAGRRDCQSVNPGSATPVGLTHMMNAGGGGAPFRAGRLDTFDLIGQCMCTSLGRMGPQLAHQAGFSCGPDENTRRLDCLMNPRGPADGIRAECVHYLQEDNPGRDTRTTLTEWCGRVAQCPPGAAHASISATGGAACSCGTGLATPGGREGGTTGGSMCSRVSCAQGPGAMGSDLYRQCCGVPGAVPGMADPSTGLPVPPPRGPPEMPERPLPFKF